MSNPSEYMDLTIDKKVFVILSNKRELSGTMKGFDDCLNLVLDDVTEFYWNEGKRHEIKREQLLLNGAFVSVIVPGSDGNIPLELGKYPGNDQRRK
mmetsp:Transcript_4132/g.6101  ORF Transcript_4132/g.6101 Transcript_4132/m.6101 type:complete len:96 (+) Transcript_4132:54-341(+)